jgi:hypothetical protein
MYHSWPVRGPFLLTLHNRPNTHGRVIVKGHGKVLIFWQETESTYGLLMCGPHDDIIHDGGCRYLTPILSDMGPPQYFLDLYILSYT